MADRVLNFKEFSDKFSEDSEQNQAASVQDIASASDNFSQGFDDTTYDKSELGPNKPVDIGSEESIAQPGDVGAPSFSSSNSGIEEPNEEECEDCEDSDEEIEAEGNEDETEDSDYEEESDEESDEDEDDDYEDDGSYGNPEGDDDGEEEEEEEEDEESNESFKWKTSNSFVLESFDDFSIQPEAASTNNIDLSHLDMDDDDEHYDWQDETDMYSNNDVELLFNDDDLDIRDIENDDQTDDSCFVKCQHCGSTKAVEPGDNPFSSDKVEDPNSWWQGAEYGVHCGCPTKS